MRFSKSCGRSSGLRMIVVQSSGGLAPRQAKYNLKVTHSDYKMLCIVDS